MARSRSGAARSSGSGSGGGTASHAQSRHLLRPISNPSSHSTSGPQQQLPTASSDVVGLIPDVVHESLRSAASLSSSAEVGAAPTGHVDGSTGLACLVLPAAAAAAAAGSPAASDGTQVDRVTVWRHRTQTLSESLVPPDRCQTFVHPEQAEGYYGGSSGSLDGSRLVALVPHGASIGISNSGGSATPSFASPRRGGGTDGPRTMSSLYVCTPSGSLAYWLDALPLGGRGGDGDGSSPLPPSPPCDSAVQLALDADGGEIVTCLAPTRAGNVGINAATAASSAGAAVVPPSEPLLLVGTSTGRVMVALRTARPLNLRARELRRLAAVKAGTPGIGTAEDEGVGGGGLIATAFSAAAYLMTPGKPKRGGGGRSDAMGGGERKRFAGVDSSRPIVDILALPSPIVPSAGGDGYGYLPSRPGSPSPTKTRRLEMPPSSAAAAADGTVHFLTVSEDMVLTKWTIGGDSPASLAAGVVEEGIEWEADLAAMAKERVASTLAAGEDGNSNANANSNTNAVISQVKVLRASVSSDGRCVAIVFLAQLETRDVRAYALSVNLDTVRGGGNSPSAIEAATSGPYWLNRHPSESLAGGNWTCGGMTVVPSSGATAASYILYSAWHNPLSTSTGHDGTDQGGAVATTVLLPTRGGAASARAGIRMCDTDLPPNVFPSLLTGMMSPDLLSGGVCVAGSTGCVADFRVAFPMIAGAATTARAGEKVAVDQAAVHSVSSHLLSAYMAHTSATDGADGSDHISSAIVPPSIHAASPALLGHAVVNALSRLLAMRSQHQGLHQSRQQRSQRDLFSPSDGRSDASATISFLNTHLEETLPSFVNFLIHAGIYLRVENRYRVQLRDAGEKMVAALALVDRWREELAIAENNEDHLAIDDLASNNISTAINSMLGAGPVAIVESLPSLLAELQRDVLDLNASGSSSVMLLDVMSALLCQAHTCALKYRSDASEDLFKLQLDGSEADFASSVLWTSHHKLLGVYTSQLQKIKEASSVSFSTGGSKGEVHVQVLASALLDGFRNALYHSAPTEKSALTKSYHNAKILAIPLLRLYDSSDIWPFDLSVEHGYFDGVFDICHDWTLGKRKYDEDVNAEEAKEETQLKRSFDVKTILEECSMASGGSNSIYKDLLPPSVDPPTGLTFPQYVLKRYADLGLQGAVLDIGRLCPLDLAKFVEEDERLSDQRWIVRVRSGRYGNSRDGLIDVVKEASEGQSVSDRELTLSLAKLCSSLDTSSPSAGFKGQTIEDGLTLTSVQRLLSAQGLTDIAQPLRPTELLNLIKSGVASSIGADKDVCIQLCLAGLAVAEVAGRSMEDGEISSPVRYAAPVWSLCIMSDAELWQLLATDYAAGASGELGTRDDFEEAIERTVLFGVLKAYLDGRGSNNEDNGALDSSNLPLEYHTNEVMMAGVMNELRATSVVNDGNIKPFETILLACAGMCS